MDIMITLFYALFSFCVVYPPSEFVAAGFTITQIFDNFLGSESTNFIKYHMKRITITSLIHASLPLGYVCTLWCCGERGEWMPASALGAAIIPMIMLFQIILWWEHDKSKHPVVRALKPYVNQATGSDWRILAADFNIEFHRVDKVLLPLNSVSKVIATQNWLIKVTPYNVNIVKQLDCSLVATAADTHNLSPSGEDEVQYVNVEVIPSRDDVKRFSFRMSNTALRELQPRLMRPMRVPESISLIPPLIERFVEVFKTNIAKNPMYYYDNDEVEQCIGCMQNQADVKIVNRCEPAQPGPADGQRPQPPCSPCNCRVLWCASCMARWWATRGPDAPAQWLSSRGSCPVCRATFCLLDVSFACSRSIAPPAVQH
ncbi:E3 ubiquitin-protein ligase TM129 [Leptidea sinapis]|uniref:E3 ubiquitin-protein ligase TM129 n=1 Tax=Leptidea sinapis TaxID=189913 RepID=UPI0021304282|nr:E3 ubiquitin-protein ligase TM129 [Leptidea sinapis]